MAEVAIVVPGIMGSQLFDGEECVWPGKLSELLRPYSKMAQLLKLDLSAPDIIREFSISEQYGSLIDDLESCGFKESGDQPTLLVCPYDWRKDNRIAAERLAGKIRQARGDHGADVVIHLIAHSMGGLVCRWLLESGEYDEKRCSGFGNIRRLITIGTPHRGAPLALCAAMGQIKRLFLSAEQVKQLADRPEFPSLYQLMPPQTEPFLWNTDPGARLDPASPHQPDVARTLGLNAQNLENAASFHSKLDPTKRPKGVAYFCFVGTRQSTIANAQANFANVAAFRLDGMEVADGGDGTVPSWSASFSGMQQLAVGGEHGGLYKPAEVRRTLGALLGRPGVLSSEIKPNSIRLSVRDEVVDIGAPIQLVLFMIREVSDLNAMLVLRRFAGSDGAALASPAEVSKVPVNYRGAPIDSISMSMAAPDFAGVYELDITVDGVSVAERPAHFLAQS